MSDCLAHDLVTATGAGAVEHGDPAPDWVGDSLERSLLMVVRRARPQGDLLPVGLRGEARHQRFGAWLPRREVVSVVRPEDLARMRAWSASPRAALLPHFEALDRIARTMDACGVVWGPVGGMGYELASGTPCLTRSSDLDLVLRAGEPLDRRIAGELAGALTALPVKSDLLIETPRGAVALAEFVAGAPRLMLRTSDGPCLSADPWQPGEGGAR